VIAQIFIGAKKMSTEVFEKIIKNVFCAQYISVSIRGDRVNWSHLRKSLNKRKTTSHI
jgi:hypothetical protein